MNDTRVARRYAQALFGAATASDTVSSVEDDLNTIVNSITFDKRFENFLNAPYTNREDKQSLLDNVFGDRVTSLTMHLVRIMLEKGREDQIPNVRDELTKLRRTQEGVVLTTVTTAIPLDEDLRAALIAKLTTTLGKKIESEYRVDPALIGGIRVAFGDYVLDGSARGSLRLLREKLRYDVLKQQ